jgi:hypothetical protein
MMENLQAVWDWFDPQAAQVGAMAVIAWYLAGLVLGWVFDMLRKS